MVDELVYKSAELDRDKNSKGENRGEMGRSFVTTTDRMMATLY